MVRVAVQGRDGALGAQPHAAPEALGWQSRDGWRRRQALCQLGQHILHVLLSQVRGEAAVAARVPVLHVLQQVTQLHGNVRHVPGPSGPPGGVAVVAPLEGIRVGGATHADLHQHTPVPQARQGAGALARQPQRLGRHGPGQQAGLLLLQGPAQVRRRGGAGAGAMSAGGRPRGQQAGQLRGPRRGHGRGSGGGPGPGAAVWV